MRGGNKNKTWLRNSRNSKELKRYKRDIGILVLGNDGDIILLKKVGKKG